MNAIGEKLSWFSERIAQRDGDTPLSPQEFKDLIDLYLYQKNFGLFNIYILLLIRSVIFFIDI